MSDREARPKGYTENKCPATLEAVAERGEDCLLCGCPALAHDSELVSGRINTSGGEADSREASDARFSVNTSPPVDAELARDIAAGIGGFWDDEPMGEDPPFGPDDVARAVVEVLVEGRLSPSAAPTNSVPSRSDSEGEGLAARIEEVELSLKQADEELARVTRAAVKGPDGYDYHWCPGVGWCPGCPPSAVPKEEA